MLQHANMLVKRSMLFFNAHQIKRLKKFQFSYNSSAVNHQLNINQKRNRIFASAALNFYRKKDIHELQNGNNNAVFSISFRKKKNNIS